MPKASVRQTRRGWRWGAAADDGHARQGDAPFRPPSLLDDALIRVIQVIQPSTPNPVTVLNQLPHLDTRHFTGSINVLICVETLRSIVAKVFPADVLTMVRAQTVKRLR